MAYVYGVGAALAAAPWGLWLAVVVASAACVWWAERQRASYWERVARDARNKARLWQAVADGRASSVSKRTLVARQFHAPLAGAQRR